MKEEEREQRLREREIARLRRKKNRPLTFVSAFFILIFVSLIGYLVYFDAIKSEDFINSPYNTRQDTFSDRVVRGSIQSSDGEVLAQTNVYEDGTEERTYPFSNIFAHAVGYDTNGKSGLESEANFQLLTSHSFFLEQMKNEFLGKKNQGDTVISSLNADLQTTAYNSLGDRRGAVVVLEPSTGRILAMVSKPDFDPNTIAQNWDTLVNDESNSSLLNRATNGAYPPGSTFKIITSTAALEAGAVSLNDTFYCPGFKIVEDRRIRCHKAGGHGSETFVQGVQNSCNPVFMEVGARLGVGGMFRGMRQLGILSKTNIDVPGEASTIMHQQKNVGAVELATMSFGQSFQLSPIRLLTSVSAVINGGHSIVPHFGVSIENTSNGSVRKLSYPQKKKIVSKETSENMKMILESVVTEGSGSKASVEGYQVGAKTGTSEKLPRRSGKYIASCIGFAPADDPKVLAVVLIDEPEGIYYGGTIAAPVVSELLDNALPYLGVKKTPQKQTKK